jgi:hypothetical protein
MPFTCEIPILDCYVRAAYLFDSLGDSELQQIGVPAYADCVVSLDGRGLLFNVLLSNGARFDRLPITALWCGQATRLSDAPVDHWMAREHHGALPLGALDLFAVPPAPRLSELVAWNAMGPHVEFHKRSLMDGAAIMYWHDRMHTVVQPDNLPPPSDRVVHDPCQYLGTFDWPTSGVVPSEGGHHGHKCAHWLIRPDGNLALQPNNRIGVALASLDQDRLFWRSEKPFRPAVRTWPDAFTSAEFLDPER